MNLVLDRFKVKRLAVIQEESFWKKINEELSVIGTQVVGER